MKVTLTSITLVLLASVCLASKSEDRQILAHLKALAQSDASFKGDLDDFGMLTGGAGGHTTVTSDADVLSNINGHVSHDHDHSETGHTPTHTHEEYNVGGGHATHVSADDSMDGLLGGDAVVTTHVHPVVSTYHEPVVVSSHPTTVSHSENHILDESSNTVNGHTTHVVDHDDTIDGHHTHSHHVDHDPIVVTAGAGC